MFKLVAFFALLAVAFAAPKPDPVGLTYGSNIPLAYSGAISAPVAYSPISYSGYNGYIPYASGYYNYNSGSPYIYRNLYL